MLRSVTLEAMDRDGSPNIYGDPVTQRIIDERIRLGRRLSLNVVASAGEKNGATTDWLGNSLAVSTLDDKEFLLHGNIVLESILAARILTDKERTRRLMEEAGLPVPRGRPVGTPGEAIEFQKQINAMVVIKPRFGNQGKGVSVGLQDPDEIRSAFRRAKSVGPVIVEEDIGGVTEYRCLTTPDRCISVVRRILPWVEGDGLATVEDLIDSRNLIRKTNPSTMTRPIPKDLVTIATLLAQDLQLSDVPAKGRRITVRSVGGLSSGGEPEECFDSVSDSVKETARAAAAAVPGLGWGGADIMVNADGDPYIIEVNTDAGILGAAFPFYGSQVPIGQTIHTIRAAHAPKRATGVPIVPEGINPLPLLKNSENPTSGFGVFFGDFLRRTLRELGAEVEDQHLRLTKVILPGGTPQWLTELETDADLLAVYAAVRKHGVVRRLLRRSTVPRVPAAITSRIARLEEFLAESPSHEVVLTPFAGRWGRRGSKTVSSIEELHEVAEKAPRTWVVQNVVPGREVKVFASQTEALAVLSAESLGEAELVNISRRAVQAIRAVPELRWASV